MLFGDAGVCPGSTIDGPGGKRDKRSDRKRESWCARDPDVRNGHWQLVARRADVNAPVPFLEGGFLGPRPTILGALQCPCDVVDQGSFWVLRFDFLGGLFFVAA